MTVVLPLDPVIASSTGEKRARQALPHAAERDLVDDGHEAPQAAADDRHQLQQNIRIFTAHLLKILRRDEVGEGRDPLEDDDGERSEYRIVGPDEFDVAKRYLSMDSPLGKALMRKALDDEVRVEVPGGMKNYVIVEVRYEESGKP